MSNTISIQKGLNIRLVGESTKEIKDIPVSNTVCLSPLDFHGLIPKMVVKEGESVQVGDIVFQDKKNEKIKFVSPTSGTIKQIVRAEKRKIVQIIIESDSKHSCKKFNVKKIADTSKEEMLDILLESGIWPSFKQRPLDVVADPSNEPKGIFISSFDSSPLAPDYSFILKEKMEQVQMGLNALNQLANGKVHLSSRKNSDFTKMQNVIHHNIDGIHPAGNIGTQIHHIDPMNKGEFAWSINIQDVAVIGQLFETGSVDGKKCIAVGGSEIKNPAYYNIHSGSLMSDILKDNVIGDNVRYISGNVLTGDQKNADGYIGYYHNQISVIPEGNEYKFFLTKGWLGLGFDKFSNSRLFPTFILPKSKKFTLDTNTNGEERAFVVTGELEKVFPFDILPMHLTKAAITDDIDGMENLGIYEVAPEDFALCEYVCTTKINIQEKIRHGLDLIASECM
ncbi:MAG: Na(+)-translocating NADH-quinone reductase subunit A [Crocinitomicaceae bacterium]|nr:Na(+)-translocating NADH-quinone reductase subunit A [Crocinitomicaceae bacterium]